MQYTREDYWKNSAVSQFCEYLTLLFNGQPFSHHYEVRWKRWAKHLGTLTPAPEAGFLVTAQPKTLASDKTRDVTTLSFNSLKGAYDAYFWPTNSQVSGDGEESEDSESRPAFVVFDVGANRARLLLLRRELEGALEEKIDAQAFIAALKILDWGQVYKGSVGWLIQEYEAGRLLEKLMRARDILDGDNLDGADSFIRNQDLRMDSGLTKVYSLASRGSVIYDDRVAAALGLLVCEFLITHPQHQVIANDSNKVPIELQFMRSASSKTRKPDRPKLKFKFPGKKTGQPHAHSNLMANWIMQKVAQRVANIWGVTGETGKLRAMECALFMLGYAV